MRENLLFHWNRIREKLWVKPLLVSILSVAFAFVASLADQTDSVAWVPNISTESIEALLNLVTSSMLVIAMFAVWAMETAYASASKTATPAPMIAIAAGRLKYVVKARQFSQRCAATPKTKNQPSHSWATLLRPVSRWKIIKIPVTEIKRKAPTVKGVAQLRSVM